ncbi:hypothetical protein [Pandoraea sp. ISTKB]|uniref:hypothetical protein n=1 Tax=Pandoraea sp. ISTKB TaxID=1586708 RepID=UPI00084708AF|nr:hypothetical protein [Pandoraea sp. ISTKB]ODP35124.1 hypothetical protein A9762_12255 [Pandoraea sp. ISTKB]
MTEPDRKIRELTAEHIVSVGIHTDDVESIVDIAIALGWTSLSLEGFDDQTTAAIADRLAFHGVSVWTSGHEGMKWRTPNAIYADLLERLRVLPPKGR